MFPEILPFFFQNSCNELWGWPAGVQVWLALCTEVLTNMLSPTPKVAVLIFIYYLADDIQSFSTKPVLEDASKGCEHLKCNT